MTVDEKNHEVKREAPSFWKQPLRWLLWEVDCHPRLGWLWVLILLLNTLLNILDLTGFGSH